MDRTLRHLDQLCPASARFAADFNPHWLLKASGYRSTQARQPLRQAAMARSPDQPTRCPMSRVPRAASSSWGGPFLVAPIACAAGLAVAVAGPLALLGAVAAVLGLALSFGRPHWTLAALAVVNFAAISDGTLVGEVSIAAAAEPLRPVVLGAAVVQAISLWLSGDARNALAVTGPTIPLLVVVFASILDSTTFPVEGENSIAFAALLLSVGFMAAFLARDARNCESAVVALAAAYGAMGLLNALLAPLVEEPFLQTSSGPRFQGLLENPNSIGLLASVGISLLVAAGLASGASRSRKRACLTGAAILGVQLLLSVSRSGLAGATLSLIVLFVILSRGRLQLRAVVGLLLVSAAAVIALTGVAGQISEALRLTTTSIAGGRVGVLSQALELVPQRPLLGHGYGSERTLVESLGDIPGGFTGAYAGNVFVGLLLEMGFLGLFAFAIASAVPLIRFAQLRRQLRRIGGVTPAPEIAVWPAVAVAGLTNAQGESFLVRPGGISAPVIWFALAMCTALGVEALRRSKTSPNPSARVRARNPRGAAAEDVRLAVEVSRRRSCG